MMMQVEQLEGEVVGLGTSLELIEEAEQRCLAVLNCTTCRQRQFALASVIVVSATVVGWVRIAWLREDTNSGISLGSYKLDRDDAEMMAREIKSLQLSHFGQVMTKLELALSTSGSMHKTEYQVIIRTSMEQLRDCMQQVQRRSEAAQQRFTDSTIWPKV
jgi:hypothetical protein